MVLEIGLGLLNIFSLGRFIPSYEENDNLITSRAIKDARADFDYTEEEILATVLSLNLNDLDQTMPSYKKPGQMEGQPMDNIQRKNIDISTCPLCGGMPRLTIIEDYELPAGPKKPAVVVHNVNLYRCEECGEEYLNSAQSHTLQQKAVEAERELKGLLSAEEINQILERHADLSADRIEKILNFSPRSFWRWRNSESIQSEQADTILRILWNHPEVLSELAQVRSLPAPKKPGRPRKASA